MHQVSSGGPSVSTLQAPPTNYAQNTDSRPVPNSAQRRYENTPQLNTGAHSRAPQGMNLQGIRQDAPISGYGIASRDGYHVAEAPFGRTIHQDNQAIVQRQGHQNDGFLNQGYQAAGLQNQGDTYMHGGPHARNLNQGSHRLVDQGSRFCSDIAGIQDQDHQNAVYQNQYSQTGFQCQHGQYQNQSAGYKYQGDYLLYCAAYKILCITALYIRRNHGGQLRVSCPKRSSQNQINISF